MSKRSLIVFKSSDYDLNEDERKLKYKDYNIIVCEKCNDKFNRGWKCRKCYINETEEEKYPKGGNAKDLSEEFLNELKFLKKFFNYCYKYIIKCFGITREPGTLNYALVFELKKSSLRDHLDNHYSSLTLKDKLDIIEHILPYIAPEVLRVGRNKEHPYNFRKYTKQYEDNKNLSYDLINELTIIISPPELQEKNKSQSPNASSIIIVETTKTAYTVNSDGCSDCGIVDHLSVIQQGSVHRIEYIEEKNPQL
ncbi:unnamed protein product [Rhizophagus irregularis]|nr:unnamed protein product [Rhizophagus irregularis]